MKSLEMVALAWYTVHLPTCLSYRHRLWHLEGWLRDRRFSILAFSAENLHMAAWQVNMNVEGLNSASEVLAKSPNLSEEEVETQRCKPASRCRQVSARTRFQDATVTASNTCVVVTCFGLDHGVGCLHYGYLHRDITDTEAYSIQEAKMKSEEENAKEC
eukprot:119552-Amphidinium_carterae.1